MWTTIVNTGSDGYANASFPIDGTYTPGKYFILANGTLVEVFKVETFKLFGKGLS